ncbi:MAG: hypothetical protein ACLR0U_26070 [Enterocloster clostridioformis]
MQSAAAKIWNCPKTHYQWRKMLTQVSIVLDNISSMVHGYGLRLLTKQGWHGAYDTSL